MLTMHGVFAIALVLAMTGGLFWALWSILRPKKGKAMVCATCGHHGPTVPHTRGSIWIELVLWLCLLVPGLVYSIWRLSTRAPACASCGARQLVPADSPVGRRLTARDRGPGQEPARAALG
jgi:uncharacterized membrane protein YqaE (UPF0057 family)